MNKRLLLIGVLLALGLTLACAQELPIGPSAVKVDGLISDKEYSLTVPLNNMTLYLTRTADTLYLALSAPTKGWVALGFGSSRMDGARIFIGSVTDGTVSLSEQLGRGHGHNQVGDPLTASYGMVEDAERTTLELALDAGDVISAGQSELMVLAAFGGTDEITRYHASRDRLTFQLN